MVVREELMNEIMKNHPNWKYESPYKGKNWVSFKTIFSIFNCF